MISISTEQLKDEIEQVPREHNASRKTKKRCAQPVDSAPHSAFQIDRKGNITCVKTSETKTDEKANSSADKVRVLLMDDDEMIRETAGQMLDDMGYEVGLARAGSEAIKLYEDAMQAGNPFDAVILDLTVPGGLGGKETIIALIETDPAVKAIQSSGSYNNPVFRNFREYGFSALLPKPYKMEDLRETLQKVLLRGSG